MNLRLQFSHVTASVSLQKEKAFLIPRVVFAHVKYLYEYAWKVAGVFRFIFFCLIKCVSRTHAHSEKLKDHFPLIFTALSGKVIVIISAPSLSPSLPEPAYNTYSILLLSLWAPCCVMCTELLVGSAKQRGKRAVLKVTQARNDSHPLEFMIRKQFKLFSSSHSQLSSESRKPLECVRGWKESRYLHRCNQLT